MDKHYVLQASKILSNFMISGRAMEKRDIDHLGIQFLVGVKEIYTAILNGKHPYLALE